MFKNNNCECFYIKLVNEVKENAFSEKYPNALLYARLMLPDLLPMEIDRVLLLDVDLIVRHSLDELYNIGIGNFNYVDETNLNHKRLSYEEICK